MKNKARNYIKTLPVMKKKDLSVVFLGANQHAVKLLELMLELDSGERINAEEALSHCYLTQFADPYDEPVSKAYDQSFEDMDIPVEKWRELVLDEIKSFVPLRTD